MINSFESLQYLVNLVSGKKNISIAEISLDTVLKIAKTNDLLLATCDVLGDFVDIPFSYQEPYQQLKCLEANSLDILKSFLEQCKENELPLLTIKSFLPFPYADSNIDIVAVKAKAIEQYRNQIKHLGFVRQRNLADIREPDKEMYYHLERGRFDRTFPKLHLHRSISWNGVVYINPKQVWQRHQLIMVKGVAIPVPSPEDELLIMAAHAMFENKYISLHELIYLNWLTTQALDWSYIIQTARKGFWDDALRYFLNIAYSLGDILEMNILIKIPLSDSAQLPPFSFPLIMPLSQTFKSAMIKLWGDVRHGRLTEFPRQIFTYLLVDCFWMYRKAWQRNKVSFEL